MSQIVYTTVTIYYVLYVLYYNVFITIINYYSWLDRFVVTCINLPWIKLKI